MDRTPFSDFAWAAVAAKRCHRGHGPAENEVAHRSGLKPRKLYTDLHSIPSNLFCNEQAADIFTKVALPPNKWGS